MIFETNPRAINSGSQVGIGEFKRDFLAKIEELGFTDDDHFTVADATGKRLGMLIFTPGKGAAMSPPDRD